MQYFQPQEFQGWYDQLDPRLMRALDAFRELWGDPVNISPAPGAVGRSLGAQATSRHNIDRYGTVQAVDVFPKGMATRKEAERAAVCAEQAGFGGIGLYPHWRPAPGLHLDVRPNQSRWGGKRSSSGRQIYITLDAALASMEV